MALLPVVRTPDPVMYLVRIWFTENGVEVYDDLGPMPRWDADVTCQQLAHLGWRRGLSWVHVHRALIVPVG